MKGKLVVVALVSWFHVTAQDTLSLNDCFQKVEQSRYSLMLQNADAARSKVNLKFHQLSMLPTLSAFGNVGAGFGRVLDNVSNQFSTSQVNFQSFGLNASTTLFNGLSFFNEKSELLLIDDRVEISKRQSLNSLYVDVTSLYVDLCMKQSEIELSEQRIQHYEDLLATQRHLIAAGSITQVDTLRSENLVLQEKVGRIRLVEQYRSAELRLNALMGVDLESKHIYDISRVTHLAGRVVYDEVYLMKLNALELKLLEVKAKRDKSSVMPSLRLDAAVGTRYSTALKMDVFDPQSPPMAYRDQLDLNLYQNVGFQLSVPIFDRGEYLKKRKLQEIKEDELKLKGDFLELNFQRKKKEMDLLKQSLSDQRIELGKSVDNLEHIYKVTMELYSNGQITFSELQDVFVEWQSELLKLESVRYESIRVALVSGD